MLEQQANLNRCRAEIEGPDGIISSIGQERVRRHMPRGEQIDGIGATATLDAFTKVFCFGGPYTSIVEEPASRNLYLSFMGPHERGLGLNPIHVINAHNALRNVAIAQTAEEKEELYRVMIANQNPLVLRLKERYEADINVRIDQLPNGPNKETLETQLRQEKNNISVFITRHFDEFLTTAQLNNIRDQYTNPERSITLVPHDIDAPGVHVEMKALAAAKNAHPTAQNFNIGLASSQNQEPGCCVGCAAECDALREVQHYVLNRTADFPQNFPPARGTGYIASRNVSADPATYLRFGRIVAQRAQAVGAPEERIARLNAMLDVLDHSMHLPTIPQPLQHQGVAEPAIVTLVPLPQEIIAPVATVVTPPAHHNDGTIRGGRGGRARGSSQILFNPHGYIEQINIAAPATPAPPPVVQPHHAVIPRGRGRGGSRGRGMGRGDNVPTPFG